ncbi:hypothetical protein FYK55_13545 [Roseiconus nitratireducens]|uniref:Uncharacterized protein n=1 Tax=Roseiconus nitratireducens TaxID=2605748 RepID=A0A5M6D8C7_9BACT|nr:hypothetical protein [Roseiconus nitratireducens]KAA5542562.1 hypothetical protein FYK55_13545 [Roseiconus nitratireducens]
MRLEIDVKGNVNVPENPLASQTSRDTFPVTSEAVLDYEERLLRPDAARDDSEVVAAERYYHQATSSSVVNKTATEQTLRDAMRHTIVRRESLPETIYAPEGYFTHGELSLLKSPVSSVAVDRMLPGSFVAVGDRYEVTPDVLCSVMNLTSLDSGKVESEVVEITEKAVRFKLQGEFDASVDGVSTRLRMVAKMTFDRQAATVTWFALAIHETRDISKAEPGFDVTATIRMVRQPMANPAALPSKSTAVRFDAPIPAERLFVELQSRERMAGAMMDRRWRMIQDTPATAVLRMIDHDTSIAQCNLRSLVKLPEGKQWTLDAFLSDVRRTLGDQLVQIAGRDERVSSQGLRVLRVVADGKTQGVPVRWIMMHFSDDQGRRLHATFTMSADQVDAFAGNDAQLAESLRFLEPGDIHDGARPDTGRPLAGPESSAARVGDRAEAPSASDLK